MERAAKRTMDIMGALVFFAIFGPLYVLVALGVRISMGTPVHFGQTRMGVDGKTFRFFKFRSMVRNSEDILDDYLSKNDAARQQWDTFQKLDNDPRITPLGHFIRKLSLDELPQFWNVLKGDMSIVGPRPCMERQRSLYGKTWGHYCAVRPAVLRPARRTRCQVRQRVVALAGHQDSCKNCLYRDFRRWFALSTGASI